MNTNIRQGKCEFADYNGEKHKLVWMVGVADSVKADRKTMIRKTDIWYLRILIDDRLCVGFENGEWARRPPLFGVGRNVYRMVLALYS